MTDSERQLVDLYLEGVLPESEHASLFQRLETDPEAVAFLAMRTQLNVDLRRSFKRRKLQQMAVASAVASTSRDKAMRWTGWLSWRPLTAAAAGIVFGMFCTSLVFGYMKPDAMATASRLFALADGSFEKQSGRLPSGFPVEFGVWSGDESEIVEKPSVEAKDEERALRFVRAERAPSHPNYRTGSCDVYQLVDLRSLKADAASSEATLELSVQFLDNRESAGEPVKFISRLYVFAGSTAALPSEWPLSQKDALAMGSSYFESKGGSPRSWHKVTTKVLLAPQADFAVVHLVAHKPKTAAGAQALFGEQFSDDVRLTLKTQPALLVRLAQRK